VVSKDSKITKLADLKGKKVAMVRGTDPHIFAVRALLSAGLTDKDITPVLVQQHADGGTALLRGDVDAWAGLDPMMAQHEIIDGAKLFYRNPDANTWGILNAREEFVKDHPDLVKRVIAAYEEARKYSLGNYDELKKIFIGVTKLRGDVVDKQLKERTGLVYNKVGPAQRESILEAGIALQKAGVIGPRVDVTKAVDDLIDDRYVAGERPRAPRHSPPHAARNDCTGCIRRAGYVSCHHDCDCRTGGDRTRSARTRSAETRSTPQRARAPRAAGAWLAAAVCARARLGDRGAHGPVVRPPPAAA